MVQYKHIIQAIENEIIKCSDYSGIIATLPPKVKGTLNKFNHNTRGLEHERGVVITDSGETVYENDNGDRFSVEIPWSGIPYEVLKSNIGLNIDHNHPIQEGFEGFATCLSQADCYHLAQLRPILLDEKLKPLPNEKGQYEYEPIYKSVTADSGNGSRMTLTITNPQKFMSKAYGKDGLSPQYLNAIKNLCEIDGEYFQFVKNSRQPIAEHLKEYGLNRINEAEKNGEKLNWMKFVKEVQEEKQSYQKQYCQDNMETGMKDTIKEFDDLGVELTFGWVI